MKLWSTKRADKAFDERLDALEERVARLAERLAELKALAKAAN